jgi:flagellar basal-body rod protein FlgF
MNVWEISAISMTDDLSRMSTVANNIANGATSAFKREFVVSRPFSDHLAVAAEMRSSAAPWLQGSVNLPDMRQGTLKFTGNPLDLALDGANSFFEVAGARGAAYTRQGSFRVDARGRLVTESGLPVQGHSGEIFVTSLKPVIDSTGRIFEDDKQIGQLRIVSFSAPGKLEHLGTGLYAAGGATATGDSTGRVRQAYLEMSNVNPMMEMVKMIETMRHFEFHQRIVQGYDGMLERSIRSLGEF